MWEQSDAPTFWGSSDGTRPTGGLATASVHSSFVLWPPSNSGPHRLHPGYCNSLPNSLTTLYSLHGWKSSLTHKTKKTHLEAVILWLKSFFGSPLLNRREGSYSRFSTIWAQESPQLHLQSLNLPLPALSLVTPTWYYFQNMLWTFTS